MRDITNEIEKYINFRNKDLWKRMNEIYTFRLLYNPKEYSWLVNSENELVTITTHEKEVNYSSFTHELLHIYLDYLGISKLEELIKSIIGIYSFEILTNDNLIGALYNFCCHKKTFPYYQKMNFSEYSFVKDRIKFGNIDLFLIKLFFRSRKIKPKAIDLFIGHSLSLLNNVVKEDELKCNKYLNKLKEFNLELYSIVEEFDNNWTNSSDLDLLSPFLVFEKKLDDWLIKEMVY